MSTVESAINHIGAAVVAKRFQIYISAVLRMRDLGRLPKQELTGLTNYAEMLEEMSEGKFKADELLAETRKWWTRQVARQQRRKQSEMRAAS